MDCRASSDLFSLHDEKFDFDVSLSPASSKGDEDEDEVFVGPVSHKKRCVSVNVVSRFEGGSGSTRSSWSPLTGDQLDAVCQEAHRLATHLQGAEPSPQDGEDTRATTEATNHREEFIQETGAKLDVLGRTGSVLSPIKRETFCVQDSPMKQLPPAVQRRLLRGSSVNTTLSTRPAATNRASSMHPAATNATSSTRPAPPVSSIRPTARHSTSSPVAVTRPQATRMSLRGKAALGVGIVLPSKPAAPPTSCSASKSKVEKTRLQPPSKVAAGWRRSPSSRPSSRAESHEDLLSDSTSVASDLSDSSLNSSLLGKRSLAPPTKNVVRNVSGVKPPPLQKRRVTDRRNTSSSSSSVSSFNSSISLSPAKGKLNSSLNRSQSGSTGPAPASISRPANHSRPRRSTAYAAAQPTSSATGGRRSLSAQARKLSEAERIKAIRSTPLKRAEAPTHQVTPAKRGLERTAFVPPTALVHPQSGLKAKPEAQVVPTPSGGIRGVQQGDDVSKMLKPKRLVSASSVDGLPQKPSAGPLTPSAGGCRPLQMKARRPSALPTPVRQRMSGIPPPTPTNQTRTFRLPPTPNADPAPIPAKMESSCSPVHADMQEEEPVDTPNIQPFCLEEEHPPAAQPCSAPQPPAAQQPPATPQLPTAPPCGAPQPELPENSDPGASTRVQSKPISNLIELETTEERNSKAQEVLLLDLPAPTLQPQEKLLIDLTNTPDLMRTGGKNCTTTQLIDLTSPLIKWSPDDKRENNAPLINLSF